MSKLIHMGDEQARRLDIIRKRRGCSYTGAVEYLLARSRVLSDLQKGRVREIEHDPMREEDRRERDAEKYDRDRERGASR
jgi:hypothetical protein